MSEQVPALPLRSWLDGPPGAPALVLGNSLGTSRAVWDPQVPALAARFRLLRYELPGHGGSPPVAEPATAEPYSIARLGAAVRALMDQHGIESAAYCGISLGGMVGMWLAATSPERISRLGLICTSAYLPPASGWMARADLVRETGMDSIVEASIGRWFSPAFIRREPGIAAAFAADLRRCDSAGYAQCCAAIAGMDLRPLLADICAPTLVMAGADDSATPPSHGALIAMHAGGSARLRVIRGAAHLANVAAAGEATAVLLGHLTGDTGHIAR